MNLGVFDYDLPADRIAQTPAEPRDSARLLLVEKATGSLAHHVFRDLEGLLAPGDLLVANDSRVLPARLRGRKVPGGGQVEILLLRRDDALTWQALVRGRVRPGSRLALGTDSAGAAVTAEVIALGDDGVRLVRFARPIEPDLPAVGDVPLPPYIKAPLADAERYQTVYARVTGSAAAPTAGLHFTPELIDRLAARGVGVAFVTLHVGLDTFRPIAAARVEDHAMHHEWAEVSADTAQVVRSTRAAGGRVVAVGTTSVRALESAALASPPGAMPAPYTGWTDLFITPGFTFQAVDALITNFHLPRTTLLLLVAAFAGEALVRRAYEEAIATDYRFYSFGDAMLIR